VVAGCLGEGARLEFTVLGDTVNTAARLEALTREKGVDVLVSGDTAAQAPRQPLRGMGEAALRGRTRTVQVFTLVHPKGGGRDDAAPARRSTLARLSGRFSRRPPGE
ncbi:MAG: adenylate/guanylate cyclase domain-containing protein, partial [Myxococcales bacterium]